MYSRTETLASPMRNWAFLSFTGYSPRPIPKNNENEIFENEIVYSKKLKDFAIVEWHNIIGAWTVLFEEIGHDKCLFLFLEEDDLIKVGDYIEINGSNNYDKLCEEFLLKIEKND